jgi:hypothetical protein
MENVWLNAQMENGKTAKQRNAINVMAAAKLAKELETHNVLLAQMEHSLKEALVSKLVLVANLEIKKTINVKNVIPLAIAVMAPPTLTANHAKPEDSLKAQAAS